MKTIIVALLVSICVVALTAQDKPLTQAEYVKMLYGIEKSPQERNILIEALRKRGIDFLLTDGIRSLTRTKGANNDELKRALEEANRRREGGGTSRLQATRESAELIERARTVTLEAVEEMPDFVVKQQIQRSAAYAGTNNFRNLDRLLVAVSYRASGEENYKLLSMNGILQNNPESRKSYADAGGTSSTGEFVTMLSTIFKPESKAEFELIDSDVIRDRGTLMYDFTVDKDRAKQMITAVGISSNSTITGMRGRIWIDRENARVLRVESEATEIPESFPIRAARRNIDYDWVDIAGEKYLLPTVSDVGLTSRERDKLFETRNLIRFRDYQKYGTEVVILDDDVEPEPEVKKP